MLDKSVFSWFLKLQSRCGNDMRFLSPPGPVLPQWRLQHSNFSGKLIKTERHLKFLGYIVTINHPSTNKNRILYFHIDGRAYIHMYMYIYMLHVHNYRYMYMPSWFSTNLKPQIFSPTYNILKFMVIIDELACTVWWMCWLTCKWWRGKSIHCDLDSHTRYSALIMLFYNRWVKYISDIGLDLSSVWILLL